MEIKNISAPNLLAVQILVEKEIALTEGSKNNERIRDAAVIGSWLYNNAIVSLDLITY